METVKVSKGQKFLRRGERVKGLYVILQGSVRAVSKNDEFDMEAGSIIGLMESGSGIYLCDYIANTECIFYSYAYKVTDDYKQIFLMKRSMWQCLPCQRCVRLLFCCEDIRHFIG